MTLVRLVRVMRRVGLLSPESLIRLSAAICRSGVNLLALLDFAAGMYGDRTALVDEMGAISYRELYGRSRRLAYSLQQKYSLGPGRNVAVLGRNSSRLVRTIVAASASGADVCFLNPELSGEQLRDMLIHLQPDLIMYDEEFRAKVVQAEDNEFYLTRGFERQPNVNGSIFMDYRNGPGADRHLIVYGHNMKNGTMFTPLLKYESRYYFDAHPVIELNTLYEDTRWEIFSVHFTDIHHDYIRVDFAGDDDYLAFAQDLQSRSLHPTDIELRADDIILTLSTCTSISDESRFAVHARLIRE